MAHLALHPGAIELTPKGVAYAERAALEQHIELLLTEAADLIRFLDVADGDSDLEYDLADGVSACLEGDDLDAGEADDSDREPSLGAPEPAFEVVDYFASQHQFRYGGRPLDSQEHWSRGEGDDDEQVNEDGGDVLDEPHDANTSEDIEPDEPSPTYPRGSHLAGGGSDL